MIIITSHLLVTIIKFLVGTKTLLKKSEYYIVKLDNNITYDDNYITFIGNNN